MRNMDPRAVRSRTKILDAVREILLAEGPEAVTHQRVADVSGVGRATVYRHWKSADEMVYALLDENPFQLLKSESSAPLEERLVEWLTWVSGLLAEPQRRSVLLHVLSRSESDDRAYRLRLNRTTELISHLNTAIGDTGSWQQLPMEAKINGVALLVGPVFMRVVFLATTPSREQVGEAVRGFLTWLDRQEGAGF